ncbi:hypothetical protein ACF3NR_05165 [Vaginella massiliensis]|uniref:hypothetical protein n=1 Tax=Vaginella massiliensis TaxID=1816680 RepID=UPI0008394B89|nr:hypothetical protein [Vaginella massiliensis]
MKMLKKKIHLLIIGILASNLSIAQSSDMKNMLKIGVNAGASTGQNTSANTGLDISYQNLVVPGFGLGVATGYNHFFGKERDFNGIKIDNNDFGVIPVAALIRVYPGKSGFYGGTDIGYGFVVGKDQVANNQYPSESPYNADMPNGGLYLRPEVGYHNRNWNFFAHFTKVFVGDDGKVGNDKFNAGTVGAGVAYNIPLGK